MIQLSLQLAFSSQDVHWKPDKRESLRELNVRISSFFDWLSTRPEKTIAVVTHGVWIEECLRRNVPSTLRGGIRVMNAEVYQCEVRRSLSQSTALSALFYNF